MKPAHAIAFLLATSSWCPPSPVLAQEAPPAITYSLEQVTGTLFKPGRNRDLYFGARASASACLPSRVCGGLRVDGSSIGDGGAVREGDSDPRSFTTAEGNVAAWKDVYGPIGPVVGYGVVLPLDSAAETIESYPQTAFAGVRVSDPGGRGWGMIGAGIHGAAGPGVKVLFCGSITLKGNAGAFVDGAIGGQGTFIRAGTTVRIKGNR